MEYLYGIVSTGVMLAAMAFFFRQGVRLWRGPPEVLLQVAKLPLAVMVVFPFPLACVGVLLQILIERTLPGRGDLVMLVLVMPLLAAAIGILLFIAAHLGLHRRVTRELRQLVLEKQDDRIAILLDGLWGSIWLHRLLARRGNCSEWDHKE